MSRTIDKKDYLRASILDRLIDENPDVNNTLDRNYQHKLINLKNCVKRDLESLLNTRYKITSVSDDSSEINNTILNYGLPDLATINFTDNEKKQAFIKKFESILKQFEPRFKSIKITYIDNSNVLDRTLKFRINATLYADPYPEIIVFDSILEPVTRYINIKEIGYV